jgi:uncharacterized membrane protein YkvA (DUF1232 family)
MDFLSIEEELPENARILVEQLIQEDLVSSDELRFEIEKYSSKIDRFARKRDDLDVNLAECIAQSCLAMLDTLKQDSPAEHRRLMQVACRYFVEEDDEEGDLGSVFGFDDDAEVLNIVVRKLGRPDLEVQV